MSEGNKRFTGKVAITAADGQSSNGIERFFL